MRIVGGRHAGRDLTSPNDRRVRPTAEPVRAALLDYLSPDLPGARVLDLFAGTGALGLEALSRGAATADFVESRPASLHALKANVVALRYRERTRIFKRDAIPFAADLPPDAYDIAFADPPYTSRMADRVLADWFERKFSNVLAIEHAAEHELPPGARRMNFGETVVTVYRLKKQKADLRGSRRTRKETEGRAAGPSAGPRTYRPEARPRRVLIPTDGSRPPTPQDPPRKS